MVCQTDHVGVDQTRETRYHIATNYKAYMIASRRHSLASGLL
uniref:Uncharacterized protein n=1 Tax=Anopheles arabiensis TaxID=7173 RepID=A0A182IHR7_ANOAR